MKKLFIILIATLFFASCEKLGLDKKDKPCPTVSADAVPVAVTKAFQDKHPEVTDKTWFNKDNNSYVALFDNNGKETFAYFDNSGNFQKEEIDNEQEGDHQDNDDDDDKGCECEMED
jgi:hypothetical protein